MIRLQIFASVLILWIAGSTLADVPESSSSLFQAVINPGDAIQIEVVGYSEFNTDGIVSPDGTILVPLVGDMQVAGLTELQLQNQLKNKLSEYIKGNIQLITAVTQSIAKPERPAPPPVQKAPVRKPPVVRQAPVQQPRQAPVISQPLPNAYIIKTGDKINVKVWGYTEFNTDATVSLGGKIDIPLVGEVQAAGLAESQLEEMIRHKLSEYVKGEIRLTTVVTPEKSTSTPLPGINQQQISGQGAAGAGTTVRNVDPGKTITVLGEIARQDNFQVASEVPLFELLSLAGGTTPESDLQKIKIMSSTRGSIEVDLDKTMREGLIMPVVHPGETVFIPRKKHNLRNFLTIFSAAVTSATGLLLLITLRR